MKTRLPLVLSTTALLVSLLGSTPLGQAAAGAVAKVVPRAKTADFATNAGKLNGHRSSTNPKAGQIPVVAANGKLPASIGAVGPTGQSGPKGDPGSQGPPGLAGYQQIGESRSGPSGENEARTYDVPQNGCPSGKSVLAGGYSFTGDDADHLSVFQSRPLTNPSVWRFRIRNTTGQTTGTVSLYAICANVSS
jgi:hypothetical protein